MPESTGVGAKEPVMGADGPSVQELLKRERGPVPSALRDSRSMDLGTAPLDPDRYTSREFAEREFQQMWERAWQMACRAEDIPEIGDFEIYEIGRRSLLIVRVAAHEIRAYHNVCLHRGRILKQEAGSVQFFRCPFHGFSWNLDGSSRSMTNSWDFEHIDPKAFCLPQVRTACWGGFVFINFDAEAESLESYLDDLPEIFQTPGWDLSARVKTVHVHKLNRCNWKVALEAFIESFHVVATHPGAMTYLGDAYTQYDVWPDRRHFTRMISPRGLASPHLGREITEEEVFQAGAGRMTESNPKLPEGLSAREAMADAKRAFLQQQFGIDVSDMTDCEALDTIQYHIFPNLVVWAGWGSFLVYRFRPLGEDQDSSIMEVFFLIPQGEGRTLATVRKPTRLGFDDSHKRAAELGPFADVFDEDLSNIPEVHRGLAAMAGPGISLGNYQEARIRHFHRTIDRYLES